MKTKWMLAIASVCVSLGASGVASAQRTELETQAYEFGWDSAKSVCRDLRPSFRRYGRYSASLTRTFSRWCRRGFDENIDNNGACQQRMRREGAYTRMWEARRDACQ